MKKKNRTWRAAALLLALTLVTSCFVGGTFAKYTTTGEAKDTARVAKWGVTISAGTDLFAKEYNGTGDNESTATVKVETSSDDKLVAPGTNGTGLNIKNTATTKPEVSYTMTIKLEPDSAKVPTLKYTPKDAADAVTYEPVKFSVYNGDEVIKADMTLADLTTLFDGDNVIYKYDIGAGGYYVDSDGNGEVDATLSTDAPDIKIKWEWAFDVEDDNNTDIDEKALTDMLDTILGDLAAVPNKELTGLPDTIGTIVTNSVITDVKLNWTATATQVD